MEPMENRTGIREFFEYGNSARFLLPEIYDFADREGIFRRLRDVSPFSFDAFCRALERDPGYALSDGTRRRMVRVLADLFREAGWIDPGNGGEPRRPEETTPSPADRQLPFFRECLRHLPSFLRGEPAPFRFDSESAKTWDRFLGCPSFRSCRKMLMGLMGIENRPTCRLLDLCYGPGWGLADAVASYPEACITAVDFTGSFAGLARGRAADAAGKRDGGTSVCWLDGGEWKGFGSPLPLEDGSFDAVLFSCGDPYIPAASRREAYAEIYRVLAPGGCLGILTRSYPDPERRRVASPAVRIATLVHDLAEGVCEGWAGFSDLEESERLFREIGFRDKPGNRGRTSFLEGTLWVLEKGPQGG